MYLVVGGASPIEVAINGTHLKGISGPLSLHGRLHVVVAIEGDGALLVVTPQPRYDHWVLVLHCPADLDLSSCSTDLPLTAIVDKKLSRQSAGRSVQLQFSSTAKYSDGAVSC